MGYVKAAGGALTILPYLILSGILLIVGYFVIKALPSITSSLGAAASSLSSGAGAVVDTVTSPFSWAAGQGYNTRTMLDNWWGDITGVRLHIEPQANAFDNDNVYLGDADSQIFIGNPNPVTITPLTLEQVQASWKKGDPVVVIDV